MKSYFYESFSAESRPYTHKVEKTIFHLFVRTSSLFEGFLVKSYFHEVEAEMLGDPLSDAQALVDTVADSLPEVEGETLGDSLRDAQAMVDRLAESEAEVEAEMLGTSRQADSLSS